MILIDANVFMYAAGAAHRHKAASADLIERVAGESLDVAVDAEVLQEILHRYRAIQRWAFGAELYDLVRRVVPAVVPIDRGHLDEARRLLDTLPELSARDALHAAVVRLTGADAICSYDRDFDAIAGVRRVEPGEVLA